MQATLERKLKERSAVAGVVGLGYVGLPLVRHFCEAGYRVVAFDSDEQKIQKLLRGESYIKHIPSDWILDVIKSGTLTPTSDFSRLNEPDCISICVPTPLNKNHEPDMQYVLDTTQQIAKSLRRGQLVVLESTTYPRTTRELLLPLLQERGLKVGEDFFLAFSPEREDPGNGTFTIKTIPKVVGGMTATCTSLASQFYEKIFERVVEVGNPEVAEMCKLLENIFRSVNIALVNELKMICDRMGINIWEVIDAASTKPFGFMPFYPGPGLGGHCIPIDPFYLSWKAREYEVAARFIELSGEINISMPSYVIGRLIKALNRVGKPVKGSRVLVLGAAYKKDVDDIRESPTIKLMELLLEYGAHVDYNDPYIPRIRPGRHHGIDMLSVDLTPESLRSYDCILISTPHSCYDPSFIVEHAQLVVDTRNLTGRVKNQQDKVVLA